MKGRVICPGAKEDELGWFSTHSVEVVMNFEKLRREDKNMKRHLLDVCEVARVIARDSSDPEVVEKACR